MGSTKIIVPDYQFSGFYYSDIVRRLRIFNRINAPEISSEVAEEPFIQLERSFSLVGHQNNVLLDVVANETLLPTLKLQDSARRLLSLIDYQMKDFSPSVVDLLLELVQPLTLSQTVIEANSLFETDSTEDLERVPFENVDLNIVAGPTNVINGAFGLELDRSGTDGQTVVGDSNIFSSATLAASSADIGRVLRIKNSILGNTGLYTIVEIVAVDRIRLGGIFGSDAPLFISEGAPLNALTWDILEFTTDGSALINGVGSFLPFTVVHAGDAFYFGSSHVMWDEFSIEFSIPGANISGVWEYYDPDLEDETPDAVTNLGSSLEIEINGLTGFDDVSGSLVRVTHLPSGNSEVILSTYSGGVNKVVTSSFIGQSGTPSTDPDDYSVGSEWNSLEADDGSSALSTDGSVSFDLPQTERRAWRKTTIQGIEAFWLRFRVVSVAGPTPPSIESIDITTGTQYLLVEAVQGETVDNEALASSNGQEDQTFVLGSTPGLRDSVRVFVNDGGEVEWTNLTRTGESLLTSAAKDEHFEVDQNSLGELTVVFGNGTRGKIPPLGVDNLRFVYRIRATENGNVGANTIINNSDGAALVSSVTNPRPAFGWQIADGADEESLALVKEAGPASLRTLNRATSPEDYEDLAVAFRTSAGTRPIARAKAIEEGYGPKTIKLIVVGVAGSQISQSVKSELEAYFNGTSTTGGVGQANTEVTVVNFRPRILSYAVVAEASAKLTPSLVATTLAALISPTAKNDDGQTFVWDFGGRVPNSRVATQIFNAAVGSVSDVDITSPSTDPSLAEDELPIFDSANLTVSISEP